MRWILMMVVGLGLAGASWGAEPGGAGGGEGLAEVDSAAHPTSPAPAVWAGVVVLSVLAVFLAAAIVGPVAIANAGEELPALHSHDEPPGSSHHHGLGGTLQAGDRAGHR